MPLYEYECAACGERTEAIQSFSEPPLTVCPHCGGALAKLLSSPAFQFKGAGWYVTDYGRSGSREKTGEKTGDSSKGEEGKAGAGGESTGAGAGATAGEGAGDSSKGKKDGGGSAGSGPPGASPPSAPSRKKKDGERK